MVRKELKNEDRLYTKHGTKYAQGALVLINGERALANFKGNIVVGYTTLTELQQEFFTRDLPEISAQEIQ